MNIKKFFCFEYEAGKSTTWGTPVNGRLDTAGYLRAYDTKEEMDTFLENYQGDRPIEIVSEFRARILRATLSKKEFDKYVLGVK